MLMVDGFARAFVQDSSTNLQCFLRNYTCRLVAGTSVELEGMLVKSPGKEQALELQVHNMKVIGSCDGEVRFAEWKQT